MRRRPPQSTRTYTLLPSTTLFRSFVVEIPLGGELEGVEGHHLRECLARGRGARRRHGGQVHAARPRGLDLHARGDDLLDLVDVRIAFEDGHRERLSGVVEFDRSDEHTSELQSLMRNSYAVFCLIKKKQ